MTRAAQDPNRAGKRERGAQGNERGLASYDIGDGMRGLVGVVGPTRMDYATVTARLSYFADSLTRMFGKNELPPREEDKE